jgi:hypothetical protein
MVLVGKLLERQAAAVHALRHRAATVTGGKCVGDEVLSGV